MIIGRDFAWGHLPRTGGDATATLFSMVPDLVLKIDHHADWRKHDSFRARGLRLEGRMLLLNIRRLPCWLVSYVNHARASDPRRPLPSSDVMSRTRLPDWHLREMTDHGRLAIHRWIRMETLRDDVVSFITSELRPLTTAEIGRIQTVQTKTPIWYDHDPHHWLTRREVERLYNNNPFWRDLEQRTYGNLLLDGDWKDPVKSTYFILRSRIKAVVLDTVVQTRERRIVRRLRTALRNELKVT